MLPLSRQNIYRQRYQSLRPGWLGSGAELEALVRRRLTPAARVLDLGCGRGGVLELFWDQVRLAVGVDPDWASLAGHRARAAGMRLPLAAGLGEGLPFPPDSFDLVLGLWVLEHLAEPERVLGEVRRVLAPGGRFIFLTPNAWHPLIRLNRFSRLFPEAQRRLVPWLYGRAEADTFPVRYRANSLERLQALASACGLEVASLRAIPDPTYLAFNDALFRLSVWLEDRLPGGWGMHLLGELFKPAPPEDYPESGAGG